MSDEATAYPPPQPGGSAFRSVMVEVTAQCPGCGAGVPLPGPVEVVSCGRCGTRCHVGQGFWRRVLADPVHEALGFPDGKGRAAQLRSEPPVRLLYGRMSPPCRGCGTLLPPEALAEAAVTSEDGDGRLFCPACGTPNRCRVVPPWFKDVHPVPGFLVNEPRGVRLPPACPRCSAPVPGSAQTGVLQRNCMKCGQALVPGDDETGPRPTAPGWNRWYLLANLGDAVGVVPREAAALADVAPGPRGSIFLAWLAETQMGRQPVGLVGGLDRRGLLRWVREVPLSRRTTLHALPSARRLAVVDGEAGTIAYFDQATGSDLDQVTPPGDDRDDLIDVRDHLGLSFAPDGTVLLASDRFGGATQLTRFEPTGRRVPLWRGMAAEEEVMRSRARTDAPRLDELGDQPLRIPDGVIAFCGWDDRVYLVGRDGGLCLGFSRDGRLERRIRIDGGEQIERVEAAAADQAGNVHLLFRHRMRVGDDHPEHVGRLRPDGHLDTWLGIHAPRSPVALGPDPERMKVDPEGSVLLGGTLPQVILVDPERRVRWHHPGRLRHQRRALEAPERRGRRAGGRVRRISSVNTVPPR